MELVKSIAPEGSRHMNPVPPPDAANCPRCGAYTEAPVSNCPLCGAPMR